jgi:AraC-like DNA-binding protein
MSGRHLHRKLENAGAGFRDLQDEIRYAMARSALSEKKVSVESVAQTLGFQESQSFIRWFRRMAGCTPGEYRQRAAQAH